MEYTYVQNQRVRFDLGTGIVGIGTVVGVATNGAPIIGRAYIIDPDVPVYSEAYPFSHFTAFESQLTPLPNIQAKV